MNNFTREGAAVALSLSLLAGGVPAFAQGAEQVTEKAEDVFDDVCAQDWFCPYVQYVYENGIMQGTSETTFSPYATMTRGMVAQILYNQAKETGNIGEMGSETPVFSDVQADQWYFEAVQWAYANGKASGVGNGRFEPERQVTREELAMFLYRDAGQPYIGGELYFSDANQMDGWAKNAILWAVHQKVMSGTDNNRINPLGSALRSEAATMFQRYLTVPTIAYLTSAEESEEEREIRIFGRTVDSCRYPNSQTAEANQTWVRVPVWKLDSNGSKYSSTIDVQIHKELAGSIQQIFQEIYDSGERFPIYSVGGYNWRGDTSSSEHCLGTALDINPNENYQCKNDGTAIVGKYWKPNEDPYSIPSDGIVVKTFEKYGFRWGGTFRNSKDYMHFSYFGT